MLFRRLLQLLLEVNSKTVCFKNRLKPRPGGVFLWAMLCTGLFDWRGAATGWYVSRFTV